MRWKPLLLAPFAAVAVLAVAPAPAPAAARSYKVVEVKDGGTIRGVCRLSEAVTMPKVSVFKDNEKGCGDKERDTERVIVGEDRALANCLVYLKSVEAGKDWPEPMRIEDRTGTIDQKGCKYQPHVQWLRKDTQVVVLNSDGADHNIHAYRGSMADTQFNFTSAPGKTVADSAPAFLEQAANYILKCDIHPWMSAFVRVVEHPYFDVTPEKASEGRKAGEFVIESVPPGEYTLVAWHEGMVETPTIVDSKIAAYVYSDEVVKSEEGVKVEAGKTVVKDFTFEAPKPK